MPTNEYAGADIATDKGERGFMRSNFDMSIPFCGNSELGEIIKQIHELTAEPQQLIDRIKNVHVHGCVKISISFDFDGNADS